MRRGGSGRIPVLSFCAVCPFLTLCDSTSVISNASSSRISSSRSSSSSSCSGAMADSRGIISMSNALRRWSKPESILLYSRSMSSCRRGNSSGETLLEALLADIEAKKRADNVARGQPVREKVDGGEGGEEARRSVGSVGSSTEEALVNRGALLVGEDDKTQKGEAFALGTEQKCQKEEVVEGDELLANKNADTDGCAHASEGPQNMQSSTLTSPQPEPQRQEASSALPEYLLPLARHYTDEEIEQRVDEWIKAFAPIYAEQTRWGIERWWRAVGRGPSFRKGPMALTASGFPKRDRRPAVVKERQRERLEGLSPELVEARCRFRWAVLTREQRRTWHDVLPRAEKIIFLEWAAIEPCDDDGEARLAAIRRREREGS